ncbi:MAG: hypothetical protein ACM3KM_00035 [Acidobacteriaceae bacterium]
MDFDIVRRIRPQKATPENLSYTSKSIIVLILLSLFTLTIPHRTGLEAASVASSSSMVFYIGDYDVYLKAMEAKVEKRRTHEQVVAQLKKQVALTKSVEQYLDEQGSPLANHVETLLEQNNWKKIVALSNAESSLCRRYPTSTANCWGVGGSTLWKMGDNLDQGIVSMNRFLNNYPLRSKVKYAQMSFDDMNGLYKQPARNHWVVNNQVVFQDLSAIERQIN